MLRLWKKSVSAAVIFLCMGFSAQAQPVTIETAGRVAVNHLQAQKQLRMDVNALQIAHSAAIQSDTIYYVFNISSGGWIIISADDVAHPIIAYSYSGSYNTEDIKPVQFDHWMEVVKDDIHNAIIDNSTPSAEVSGQWADLSVDTSQYRIAAGDLAIVGPLLTTEWDQGTYYNELCPADGAGPGGHVWAGCVATAMAQVMKYHNHPTTGVGTHSYTPATNPGYGLQTADFGSTTYNWGSMPNEISSSNTNVATLIYHAAVSVDMNFTPTGSAASTSDTASALVDYFKYSESAQYLNRSDFTDNDWYTKLVTEINNNRPVIYRGDDGTYGHAFVCDGYDNGVANNYFHFNWGWSGSYNGYFYLDDLTPGTGHDYTGDQAAVMGITPLLDPTLTYPYTESFEGSIPAEWLTSGARISISLAEAHDGSDSLLIGTLDGVGYSYNNATLHINVPDQGASLSFWVKRGYNPAASAYNQQIASLKTQFSESTLHTFYDGDFNDSTWQEMSLDLTPWAGTNVKLFIEQNNSSTSYRQWTYVDHATINANTIPGDIDGSGFIDLTDVIVGLQLLSGIDPTEPVDAAADVDGDGDLGLAEVIYDLKKLAD